MMFRSLSTALFCGAALVTLMFASQAHAADNQELGLELIPWSKKVGDRRYESPRDYEGTVKFYKDKFKGWKNIKWTREVSVPAVKYLHFETTTENSKWMGVNIYELPDQRVRYFILERPKAPPPAPASPASPASSASPASPAPTAPPAAKP
jgi:hypothetical protein